MSALSRISIFAVILAMAMALLSMVQASGSCGEDCQYRSQCEAGCQLLECLTSCVDGCGTCLRLPFKPCCGDKVCSLSGPTRFTCVDCLKDGELCFGDDDCCSGRCNWMMCAPPC